MSGMKKSMYFNSILLLSAALLTLGAEVCAQTAVIVKQVHAELEKHRITLVGTVEPTTVLTVQAKSGGRIANIEVAENQQVRRGQLLLGLENETAKLQVQLARLQVKLNENTLRDSLEALEDSNLRLREEQQLYEQGTSTRQKMDALKLQNRRHRINVESGRIRIQVSKKELRIREEALEDTLIRSPIAGVVTRRMHEPGEVVGSGSALLELIDIETVEIVCGVAEEELRFIKEGFPVRFSVSAFPGKKFKGTILRLARTAESQSRRFTATIRAHNPERMLRGGMTAQVQYESPGIPVVTIPPSALRNEKQMSFVYVVEGGILQLREVEVLGYSKGLLRISGKLKAGDQVVVSPRSGLSVGLPVLVQPL